MKKKLDKGSRTCYNISIVSEKRFPINNLNKFILRFALTKFALWVIIIHKIKKETILFLDNLVEFSSDTYRKNLIFKEKNGKKR